MQTIEDIFNNAMCLIEKLHCSKCNDNRDFYLTEGDEPKCNFCNSPLEVNYSDLKPVGLLSERAPIKRFKNTVA